jgi:hypothetical protein
LYAKECAQQNVSVFDLSFVVRNIYQVGEYLTRDYVHVLGPSLRQDRHDFLVKCFVLFACLGKECVNIMFGLAIVSALIHGPTDCT